MQLYLGVWQQQLKKLGCEICEETPVVEKEGIVVKTDTGHTVTGGAGILANQKILPSIRA